MPEERTKEARARFRPALIVLALSAPELQTTGAIPLVASKAVSIAVRIALVAVAADICIIRPKII